jgi:DNA-binding NarL/FixJ family response regulator
MQMRGPPIRAGIASRLSAVDGVTVVAHNACVADLLDALGDDLSTIDVVVIECDNGSHLDVDRSVAAIAQRAPEAGIVGVHSDLTAQRIEDLRRRGVRCLVDRSSGVDSLAAAVVDPGRPTRRRWLTPTIGPLPLSEDESRVLSCIAEGHTVREIAVELGISARAVEAHKQRAYAKLGVQNQAHAVSAALRGHQLPAPSIVDLRLGDIRQTDIKPIDLHPLPATGTEPTP